MTKDEALRTLAGRDQMKSGTCSYISWGIGRAVTKIKRFQKISIPIPRTAFRISKGEGGGSRLWNSEGMGGGVVTTGNQKAWGSSTGGISGVESVE